jgi:hypothetical protein
MRLLLGIAAAAGVVWWLTSRSRDSATSSSSSTESRDGRECGPGAELGADGRCHETVVVGRGGGDGAVGCLDAGTCYECSATPPAAPEGKTWVCRSGLWKLRTLRDDEATDLWEVPLATAQVYDVYQSPTPDSWDAAPVKPKADTGDTTQSYDAGWLG